MGHSKSGLFLMELIIAIAFFSFASAMCIQLFASSHTISEKSAGMNMAVSNAQSAAEVFKATNGNIAAMRDLLDGVTAGGTLYFYYDKDWNQIQIQLDDDHSPQVRYMMSLEPDITTVPAEATIIVKDRLKGEELYRLTVKKYLG